MYPCIVIISYYPYIASSSVWTRFISPMGLPQLQELRVPDAMPRHCPPRSCASEVYDMHIQRVSYNCHHGKQIPHLFWFYVAGGEHQVKHDCDIVRSQTRNVEVTDPGVLASPSPPNLYVCQNVYITCTFDQASCRPNKKLFMSALPELLDEEQFLNIMGNTIAALCVFPRSS